MPWLENHRDWPHAMSTWDAARLARHAAHAARFVAAGWRAETASILSFDLVLEEDEAAKEGRAEARTERVGARA